jgi:general secretion pathway protein N
MTKASGKPQFGMIIALLALGCQVGDVHALTSRDGESFLEDAATPKLNIYETERSSPPKPAGDPVGSTPAGNPLWAIPLSKLSASRDRPVFSPSRRPPPRVPVAPIAVMAKPPAPVARPSAPLNMKLVGAVVGESDAIAIFINLADHTIFRMRPGNIRDGWQLNSILGREATLKNGDRTEVLVLSKPGTALDPQPPSARLPGVRAPGYGPAAVTRTTPNAGDDL